MTLAIILGICIFLGGAASVSQTPASSPQTTQAPASAEQKTQPPAQPEPKPQAPQQPEQPCPPSKDTCELPPEPAPSPAANPSAPAGQAQQGAPANPAAAGPAATKPSHRKTSGKKMRAAQPASGPKKKIVREGGTAEPSDQLTPGMSAQQASHSRQTTGQLLAATDANLKRASERQLNPNQKAMVEQIKIFMEQANAAVKVGDLQRGRNLAMKAHLLSDDLVKH